MEVRGTVVPGVRLNFPTIVGVVIEEETIFKSAHNHGKTVKKDVLFLVQYDFSINVSVKVFNTCLLHRIHSNMQQKIRWKEEVCLPF